MALRCSFAVRHSLTYELLRGIFILKASHRTANKNGPSRKMTRGLFAFEVYPTLPVSVARHRPVDSRHPCLKV
jgi:hypothetical protein